MLLKSKQIFWFRWRFALLGAIFSLFPGIAAFGQTWGAGFDHLGPNASVPYIDIHNHLIGAYGAGSGREGNDFEGAVKTALKTMDKLGIRKMLVLPPPFSPGHRGRYTADDFLRAIKKYPDRFGFLDGGGSLNVLIQENADQETVSPELKVRFEKEALAILKKGAVGFGELTALHFSLHPDHPFMAAAPDHPLFLLLADIAADGEVPIDLHMEAVPRDMPLPSNGRLGSPQNPKALKANIPAFERLLDHNPKAKIIWAHAGWCNTGYRTTALCRELLGKHANLYMSFKIGPDSDPACRPLDKDLRIPEPWLEMIKAFPDRFLVGTDQFYVTPKSNARIGPQKTGAMKYFLSWLPDDLVRKVAIENPKFVYKLAD